MNDREKILHYLANNKTITQRDAMVKLGIGRLSARIYDLRQEKYDIPATTIRVAKGQGSALVAAYSFSARDKEKYKKEKEARHDAGREDESHKNIQGNDEA